MKEEDIQEFIALVRSYDPKNEWQVNRLAQIVYPHLRRIAAGLLRHEKKIGVSMQATMLATDSVMRLIVKNKVEPKDWPHFLSIAARAMRQMLVDHIRHKMAIKGPGLRLPVELEDDLLVSWEQVEVLALDEAIGRLDPEYQELVVIHYFGGATINDLARRFEVTDRTVKRKLRAARLRLYAQLADGKTTS